MKDTIVVLVEGEVLADGRGTSIPNQKNSCLTFAEGLAPILTSKMNVAILHGNKAQVGFVLLRAEIASHVLHSIPLDVCGADTQGATGYMLNQAILNVLRRKNFKRNAMCILTQTMVDTNEPQSEQTRRAIGPWYDRDRAVKYREARKWTMIEEPGRGYRRTVPSLLPIGIIEIEGIKQLVNSGIIVIAAGGGGVPVAEQEGGQLVGVEAVVGTENVANMFAQQLGAKVMLIVVEAAAKYILERLSIEKRSRMSLEELDQFLENRKINSRNVKAQLIAASKFLNGVGELVVITTLESLPSALVKESGLWIGNKDLPIIL